MNLLILALIFLSIPFSGAAQSYDMFQAKQAFQNQEYHKVVSITGKILKKDSLNLQAHQLRASSLLAQKQVMQAEEAADHGLRIFPKAPSLLWIKAESLLQRGDIDAALPIYQQLRNANTSFSEEMIRQRLGLIYQSKGGTYYNNDKLELAEKNLEKAKDFMPDTLASYSNLALVYIKQEKWDKALEVIDEGRGRFPNEAGLQQIRANILLKNGDYDKVISEYEDLYQKNTNNLDVALPYAQLLMARGNKEKASEIYDKLIEENANQRKIYESLVEFYDHRHNQDAKRQALRKMQEQFPGDVSILKRIAQTYEKKDEWKSARAVYDSVQTMEGISKNISIAIARTFIQEDSLSAADEIYKQALKNSPLDEELLKLRGKLQQNAKQWEASEKTFTTLAEINNSSYAYSRLAYAQAELGDTESAFTNYRKAMARRSEDPKVYLELSRMYMQKDSLRKAYEFGEKTLRMSLENVQELQQGIVRKLEGNQNLAEMQSAESEGMKFKEMNELAIHAFEFVTTSFPQKDIMPLLKSLRQDYPQSGRLLYLISQYYQKHEKNEEALLLLKQSVRLAPNLGKVHKALGAYYQESNHIIQAIQSYERALSVAPEEELYIKLIELYRETGRLNWLCERWFAKYRANPNNKLLKEYLIAALHKADRFEEAKQLIKER